MESFTTDELLTALNPMGKIQALFLVSSTYLNLFIPLHSQTVNFLAATPEHHCVLIPGYPANESLPTLDGDHSSENNEYARCLEYVDPDNKTETQRCQNGWEFETDVYGETIISEWDLVCGQKAAAEISQVAFQSGGLVGALLFGMLADRYGRRPSFLVGLIFFSVSGLGLCASANYVMFVAIRFLNGLSQMATWVPLSGNLSEYMIPKYRVRAMAVPGVAYTFGLMLMALLAFLIRDWRYLQLAVTAPMVAGSFAMCFLPESLRWLMSKGKEEKAEVLVRRLSKINGVEALYGIDSPTIMNESPLSPSTVCTISGDMTSRDPSHQTGRDPVRRSEENERKLSSRIVKEFPPSGDKHSDTSVVVGDDSPSINNSLDEGPELLSVGLATRSTDVDEVESSREILSVGAAKASTSKVNTVEDNPEKVSGVQEVGHINNAADVTVEKCSVADNNNGEATWLDIFKSPVLYVTLVLSVLRFTYALVYFGFALSTGRLAGNPYLNFFFSALVELPARLLATVVYKRIRRTYLLSLCFSACFIGLGLIVILPYETRDGVDLTIVRSVLSLSGKFFVTLTLPGQMLLVMELYPTTIRNMGHGWTMCMGRCGAIVAPFMLYLDKVIWNFSGLLMAVMSFVTAIVILTLPDTRRIAQPQSTDDLRHILTEAKEVKKKRTGKNNPGLETTENRGFELD